MPSYSASHPLDTDLLDFVTDALDDGASRAVEAHLASCLMCRIKRQRLTGAAPIDLIDVRTVRVPEFGAIEVNDVPGVAARRGDLWLTASDDASMVLVTTVRDNDYGLVVVPVTLDVEVADSGALVLDASASPLSVPIAIYDRLPVSLPASALSGRVIPLRSGIDLLALALGDPGVSRGSALEGPADPRLEVRQFLSDRLVALDSYGTDDGGDDPPSVDAGTRLAALREEIVLRRGSNCDVDELALLPSLRETPEDWRGFAYIKEFMVRIIVIDVPGGLNDERDYVCAQALLTRLDGSALVACDWYSHSAYLFDAPSLFHAFELPDGARTSGPLISGLSLVDTVAKFLDQKRFMFSSIGSTGPHAARVDAQVILAEQVAEAVDASAGRASRLGPEKGEGYRALAGLKDGLTEVLKAAFDPDFDPQSIVALVEGENP